MRIFAVHLAPLAIALIGCRGQRGTTPPPPVTDLLSQTEMVELCVELHTNAAACPTEFTKMNLDLRAKYSPEFAQQIADPETRRQAEAAGVAETAADAASARERCTEFAKPEWGKAQPRGDVDRLDACYALTSCDAKMACVQPIVEPRFAYRAANSQRR
jgi:hypothetical protein